MISRMSVRGAGPVPNRLAVIDDDASVREALKGLLRAAGFSVEVYPSAEEFLTSGDLEDTACLILDVRMPGMSGFDLQERLKASRVAMPLIFITADGDGAVRARALADGAVDFLHKPFKELALLSAIEKALGELPSP
jgi:FixJ family two-component response regulator